MDKSKWEYKKLGEVCEVLDKFRKPVTKSDRVAGQYPYYGATGIQDYVADYIFDGRYLLLGEDGAKWGANENSAFIIEGKSWVNNHAHILKIDDSFMDIFVMYYLNHKDLSEYITGAVVPKLTQAAMLKIPVPNISIADQQRIVAELDCLNEMIALKQEQLKEFDKLAQSIFYDMFGDKDFPMYQLKDILSKIGSGATPSGGNQSYKTEGISLIRSLNVHNNLFVYKDLAFIDEQQAKQLNNVTIEEGDVLLNITGASVARCCVVPNDVIPARVNQHVSILRPRKELLDSLYLCHFLISCDEQAKLLSLSRSKAATREALPKNLLEKYSVPLPSLALQQQFAEKIQAIEAQKELVKQSIAETQHLLDSRMDYYFD